MQKKKISKLIIPAAGFGTRFMPATKSIPKELIPVIDKPSIQYIVEEAINAGINDIYIIISPEKNIIKKHFTKDKKLKQLLKWKNREQLLSSLENIYKKCKITYIYQNEQLGLGHAIWTAKEHIKNECFAVILADDIAISKENEQSAIKQCIDTFIENNADIVLGVQEVNKEDVSKYGILDVKSYHHHKNVWEVVNAVEKPKIENAPSRYAILGRYVFTSEIFEFLEKTPKDSNREIEITNAISQLINSKNHLVLAQKFDATRYDIGSPEGFILANLEIGLEQNLINKNTVLKILNKIET